LALSLPFSIPHSLPLTLPLSLSLTEHVCTRFRVSGVGIRALEVADVEALDAARKGREAQALLQVLQPSHNLFGLVGALHRNVQRFRGGPVFKAHRLCVSLNSRLESNKAGAIDAARQRREAQAPLQVLQPSHHLP